MSGAQSYEARAHIIAADGTKISSGNEMKILGFHVSNKLSVHAHIKALSKRMRSKYWVLYHLKKAGFSTDELCTVYRTCLLPVLDYCSVVYHSVLTDEQDQAVEKLQSSALRCIFGYDLSYMKMRELAGVTTHRERRILACDKFAQKCLGSDRFSKWFPTKGSIRTSTRSTKEKYVEDFARCNRLRDSPLFYMRRRMNGKDGKNYGERNKQYRDGSTSGRSDVRPKFKPPDDD